MRHSSIRAVALAFGAVAVSVPAAAAATLQQAGGHVDLLAGSQGVHVGPVWPTGDVNGDGRSDVAVRTGGGVKVIFSGTDGPAIGDVAGAEGFSIVTSGSGPGAGGPVTPAGDLNGDGRGDMLVGGGTPPQSSPDDPTGGSVFVIYGRSENAQVDVSSAGIWGYRIDGLRFHHLGNYTDEFGQRIAPAGDVNQDGVPDALITAGPSPLAPGTLYVVFGQSSPSTDISVAALGSHGYRITSGQMGSAFPLLSPRPVGDVNADGVDDILLREVGTNRVDVVFGQVGAQTDVNPEALGARGYRVVGEFDNELTGVDALGDVNGDGKADFVAFGSKQVFPSNPTGSWVLYGKSASTTDVVLPASAARGYKLFGYFGDALAVVGDFAGTGGPMIATGDVSASPVGYTNSDGDPIDRSSAGQITVRDLNGDSRVLIDGASSGDQAGYDLAGAGDLNGDSHPDLIVGTKSAIQRYALLFGFSKTSLSYPQAKIVTDVGASVDVTPNAWRPTGKPDYSVEPGLPPGLVIDRGTGTISGTPSAAVSGSYKISVSDLAGQASFDLAIEVRERSGSGSGAAPGGAQSGQGAGSGSPTLTGDVKPALQLRRLASVIRVSGQRAVFPCRLVRGSTSACSASVYVGSRRAARGRGTRSASVNLGRSLRRSIAKKGRSGLPVRVVIVARQGDKELRVTYRVRLRLA